jgi:group I intron endonuclease
MSIYTIYKSVNTKTGKIYIGFDSNWPNRVRIHKSASKKQDSKFYRAIRKYDWNNFEWSVIYQSKDKQHTLKKMETHFINEYDSMKNGYNSTLGGDGTFGYKVSDKTKKLISEGNKVSKPHTPEHNKKIGDANRGKKRKPLSDEMKLKISQATKGIPRPMSEQHKKNLKCHQNNLIKLTCPHCNKTGQLTNMKRWHFDNCKLIPKVLVILS